MYSPKIKSELIPKIYKLAKARGIRMTTFVNKILRKALDEGKEEKMESRKEGTLLEKLGKIKAEIQVIQLWIDDAPTNRIARIRYEKTKEIKFMVEDRISNLLFWLL